MIFSFEMKTFITHQTRTAWAIQQSCELLIVVSLTMSGKFLFNKRLAAFHNLRDQKFLWYQAYRHKHKIRLMYNELRLLSPQYT